MPRAKTDPPTVKLTLRIPAPAHRRLAAIAKREERPVAWVIRQAIRAYVEGREATP